MLLSIIIPVYNVQEYIAQCIKSVVNQNLEVSEYEILVINDGSTDESLAVVTKLLPTISNMRVISQENQGLSGARNTGINNANGTYLLFLDADDCLITNVLKKITTQAIVDQLDILEFAAQGINSENKITYHIQNESAIFLSGFEYYNTVRYMNSACNKLYRSAFLQENQLLFLPRIYIEDFEFNTRCLAKAKRLKATNTLISQFLQTENSITRNTDVAKREKMSSDIIHVIKIIHKSFVETPYSDSTNLFYLERLNYLVVTLFYQLIKRSASYGELLSLKQNLENQGLFYVNHKIFDKRKNLMRIVLIKNLWLYKLRASFIK